MTRSAPADTVTLHIPFRLAKRGGRKEMHFPEGITPPRRPDDALLKALARAFRWKRMIGTGRYATITDLAAQVGIAPSYLTRVLASRCSLPTSRIQFWKGGKGRT